MRGGVGFGTTESLSMVVQVMVVAIKQQSADKLLEHFALRENLRAWEDLWETMLTAAYAGKLSFRVKPYFRYARTLPIECHVYERPSAGHVIELLGVFRINLSNLRITEGPSLSSAWLSPL